MPTLAWKQIPFVTVLLAEAMASFDRSTKEAAHNLGAGRLRCLIQIMPPQVLGALRVSLVTIMSVLSGPMMLISGDITDGGAPQDYALVQEILGPCLARSLWCRAITSNARRCDIPMRQSRFML